MEREIMLWMACAIVATSASVYLLVVSILDQRWAWVATCAAVLGMLAYGWHDAVEIFQSLTAPTCTAPCAIP